LTLSKSYLRVKVIGQISRLQEENILTWSDAICSKDCLVTLSVQFATPPEKDRARVIGNMHKHLVKFDNVIFELCKRTDRQTDRQIDILISVLGTPLFFSSAIAASMFMSHSWLVIVRYGSLACSTCYRPLCQPCCVSFYLILLHL